MASLSDHQDPARNLPTISETIHEYIANYTVYFRYCSAERKVSKLLNKSYDFQMLPQTAERWCCHALYNTSCCKPVTFKACARMVTKFLVFWAQRFVAPKSRRCPRSAESDLQAHYLIMSPRVGFPLQVSYQILYTLLRTCWYPVQFIFLDLITLIIFDETIPSSSFISSKVEPFLYGYGLT
jgi:hypothetical protein